jgi:hypothetical protein
MKPAGHDVFRQVVITVNGRIEHEDVIEWPTGLSVGHTAACGNAGQLVEVATSRQINPLNSLRFLLQSLPIKRIEIPRFAITQLCRRIDALSGRAPLE